MMNIRQNTSIKTNLLYFTKYLLKANIFIKGFNERQEI